MCRSSHAARPNPSPTPRRTRLEEASCAGSRRKTDAEERTRLPAETPRAGPRRDARPSGRRGPPGTETKLSPMTTPSSALARTSSLFLKSLGRVLRDLLVGIDRSELGWVVSGWVPAATEELAHRPLPPIASMSMSDPRVDSDDATSNQHYSYVYTNDTRIHHLQRFIRGGPLGGVGATTLQNTASARRSIWSAR